MNMMKSLLNIRTLDNHKSNNSSQFCSVSALHPRVDHDCEYPSATYKIDIPGRPEHTLLKFQVGKPSEKGHNGILDSALLAILIDRQEFFLKNAVGSEENEHVIEYLCQALEKLKQIESNYAHGYIPKFLKEK